MSMDTERQRDILLMLFAVQFTLLVLMVQWWWPLLLFPVLLTLHVMKSEYDRRLDEESLL
ncbi:hypothetical protein OB955_04930 [Halobacteria archaeon AArc-m2/3/4]|uniref:Transmembrane protein n=1 Tax=Natronoglomus mannanivorans TaxID=2979990 RepID=A0ABT2QAX5_9EURY|nr:hypothetical protein [Halobacteria archaeon AArc-m2/3/4]